MVKKKKARHQVYSGVQIAVYTMNGAPLPDAVKERLEDSVQRIVNESVEERLLMQVVTG